jgi:serine/threonine-protein kinase
MIGKTISHYKILEKLGEGGMGVVYKAEDTRLRRTVALKFLSPEMTRDADAKRRFEQEARAAATLEHINVCNIYEIDETADGQTYIVMACYDGETLKDRIHRGPLRLEEAIDIAMQIGEGLKEAHEKKLVHRDIKGANIMITSKGQAKIMDFGLAKLSGQTKLTKEASTIGTVAYMSPEQAAGKEVDHRTDIWSLGVLLYEMITGRLPFRGEYEPSVIYSILNENPEPVTGLRTGVPVELERIINKILKKTADERYQTVSDALVDLQAVKRTGSPERRKHRPGMRRPLKRYALLSGALLVMITLIVLGVRILFTGKIHGIESIAVLPLENLSDDPAQEYFVDGMTDALIAELAQISALRIISRTSVMRYKGTRKSLPEIAGEINVDALVEGTVLQSDGQVRITVQLVQANPEKHLWADNYVRDLQDVIQMQKEVARSIAHEIQVSVTRDEQARLLHVRTVNPEAHEAYLKGRYYFNQRTKDGFSKAIEYFNQAIGNDPDYAAAYAGLSDCYCVAPAYYLMVPAEAYPKAKAAAITALELDDNNPEANASLAGVKHNYDWAFSEAESLYKKAISLNPNFASAHQWYGELLTALGRSDEAMAEVERAHELDPFSPVINSVWGQTFFFARDYDGAIRQLRYTLELHPDFHMTYYLLSNAYSHKNMHEEAIKTAQKSKTISDNPLHIANLGYIYAKAGEKEKALEELRLMKNLPNQQLLLHAATMAILYIGLGDQEMAFYWLERAFEQYDYLISFMNVNPQFDTLRSDPRFIDLLKRIGLRE